MSLYPKELLRRLSLLQLFTLVWLIWELSLGREQKRLMQAYVLDLRLWDRHRISVSFSQDRIQRYAAPVRCE